MAVIKPPIPVYIDEQYVEWFDSSNDLEILRVKSKDRESSLHEVSLNNYAVFEENGMMTLFEPLCNLSKGKESSRKSISSKRRRSHQIDIDGFIARYKTYPASKKDILGRVIGRKTQTIIDATAGWGGDALHLCAQGFDLRIIERNNILIGFLREALSRLRESHWAEINSVIIPKLIPLDSIEAMRDPKLVDDIDCIYLDPMFPDKRKRSALAKKNMQVLHDLVGEDLDQEALFSIAYSACKRRVVVKRPDYAQSLGSSLGIEPTQILQGKLMHFDIYLKH